jgi:hypothetical protein
MQGDMCLNCGCGEYDEKHESTDITLSALKEAAAGHDMDVERARRLKRERRIS